MVIDAFAEDGANDGPENETDDDSECCKPRHS